MVWCQCWLSGYKILIRFKMYVTSYGEIILSCMTSNIGKCEHRTSYMPDDECRFPLWSVLCTLDVEYYPWWTHSFTPDVENWHACWWTLYNVRKFMHAWCWTSPDVNAFMHVWCWALIRLLWNKLYMLDVESAYPLLEVCGLENFKHVKCGTSSVEKNPCKVRHWRLGSWPICPSTTRFSHRKSISSGGHPRFDQGLRLLKNFRVEHPVSISFEVFVITDLCGQSWGSYRHFHVVHLFFYWSTAIIFLIFVITDLCGQS